MGNRLKSERVLKGLTQAELADLLGIDESTVGRYEGGSSIPSQILIDMRGIFGCSIDWLLGISEQRTRA